VGAQVKGQRVGHTKCLAADLAGVGLLTRVNPFVLDLFEGTSEHPLAVLAGKPGLLLVDDSRTLVQSAGGLGLARFLVDFLVHLVGNVIFELSVADAAHNLVGGLLVHLFVYRQEVLIEAGWRNAVILFFIICTK